MIVLQTFEEKKLKPAHVDVASALVVTVEQASVELPPFSESSNP